MTTKQTDTVAMTEQQLDAVAGGINCVELIKIMDGGRRSSNPTPHPSPFVTRRPTDAGRVVGVWDTNWTSGT